MGQLCHIPGYLRPQGKKVFPETLKPLFEIPNDTFQKQNWLRNIVCNVYIVYNAPKLVVFEMCRLLFHLFWNGCQGFRNGFQGFRNGFQDVQNWCSRCSTYMSKVLEMGVRGFRNGFPRFLIWVSMFLTWVSRFVSNTNFPWGRRYPILGRPKFLTAWQLGS